MKILWTSPFEHDFAVLPAALQKQVEKTLRLLDTDFHHPSLHAKEMKGTNDVWEARVPISDRITYQVSGDTIILRRVGTHDILKEESR
jgi:mRNA-degrading endonuclease YafQ of YafQ-DinJ toxin-antitoxin module